MSARPDLRDVFETVREYLDAVYPGNRGITITVQLAGVDSATLPVPACMKPASPGLSDESDELLNTTDRAILEALASLSPGQKVIGEKLSELAGYSYGGRFRERLSLLVKIGRLNSSRDGYSLPE